MEKAGKYIVWILVGVLCLVLTSYLVIQIPYVQTKIARYALEKLTKDIDADFTVGDLNIRFFNTLHIKDFAIVSKDSLTYVKDMDVAFSLRGLLDKSKAVKSISIDGGVFNLIYETESLTNIDRIFPSSDEESESPDMNILLNKLTIKNFRFNLCDPFSNRGNEEGEINFANLKVKDIDLEINDFIYKKDNITANIDHLSASESCGFAVDKLDGQFTYSKKGARIDNFKLNADGTSFNSEYFNLGFDSLKDLSTFIDSVKISSKFTNSTIAMKTLGRFAPEYLNSDLVFLANGQIEGTVSDLYINQITLVEKKSTTAITLTDASIKGLPDVFNSAIRASRCKVSTTGKDLSGLIAQLSDGQRIDVLDNLPPLKVWNYDGRLSGTIGNIITEGNLSSGSTNLALKFKVNTAQDKSKPLVEGLFDATDVNLFDITHNPAFGLFSGKGSIKVETKSNGSTAVSLDSLRVRRIGINGYNLTGIYAKGRYEDETFDGKLICHDPALDLMLQGNISTNLEEGGRFNFYANIPYIDLYALNLDKRDSISQISTFISADLESLGGTDIFGYLKMDNTTYTNSNGTSRIGDLDATSFIENDKYVINLVSDFAKARYEGTTMIDGFINELRHQILKRHFSNLLDPSDRDYVHESYNQSYSLTLQTLEMQGLCEFLKPGLYIQKGTSLRLRVSDNDHYRLLLNSGRLAYEDNFMKNVRITVSDRDSTIAASFFSKDVVARGIKVDSTRIVAQAKGNNVDFSLSFHNDTTGLNNTNVNASVSFLTDTLLTINNSLESIKEPIAAKIRNSDITLKGIRWDIAPSEIIYSDSLIIVHNLKISNKDQMLTASGTLSEHRKDSLGITMDKFNIAIFDQFLEDKIGIEGLLSGNAMLSMNKQDTRMFASFRGDSMYVNSAPVGTLYLRGKWDYEKQHYDIGINTVKDGKPRLDINGFYRPKDSYVDMSSTLDNLSITYFEPFLEGVFTDTEGTLSGNVRIFGPSDKLEISSTGCSFNKFSFTVDYLKVPMTIDGPFSIDSKNIILKNCLLTDKFEGKGRINGGLTHNMFEDIKINTKITFNNFHCLNTLEKDNEDFYGTAFASGSFDLTGDVEHLNMSINIRNDRKTFIHFPLSGAYSSNSSDILTFKEEERHIEVDPYDTLYFSKSKISSRPLEIGVDLNMNVNPDANIWLEIDKSTGDIMKAKGSGRIQATINPTKDIFKLAGNYEIAEGSYHLVLMGLASRDFTVEPGSNITLNGKIGNTALNIDAIYTAKANINRLISDTTSLSASRTVNANIKITGILDDPKIKFGIDIPDLDPSIKMMVESALNSEDKLQKQFASLLAFGNFTPEAESGVSSSSSAIYSNATSMIVGQLNNLLLQLGIPLDFGFNYQQGDRWVSDAYEVAVSTQLFNNRVIINGSMGNDPYGFYTGRDVRGNIDVQVKMDRKGKIRMTFFSHATDLYSNYLEWSQRTGIGIAYQHEFNSFKDLFKKKSAARKEYERMLKLKEKEERKKERQEKKAEREARRSK